MSADITRISNDVRQGYRGPVMQQGRVILDRDFNALNETLSHAIDTEALDIVGPCGTPDNGFAISIPSSSSPHSLHPLDFLIGAGTMYVGGLRVIFPAPAAGQLPLSYFHQPDWPEADQPGNTGRFEPELFERQMREFVYLHLREYEVSAVEDPELKDVALGGVDTSQRLRLIRRVKRTPGEGLDCGTGLEKMQLDWGRLGLLFDPNTMQLVPQATLRVSFTEAQTTSDPCDPTSQGGYLGADNQLIRVQLSDGGNGPGSPVTLLWGYDNASFIHRAVVSADGITVQLSPSPVDAFHSPQARQVVEILRTAAVLGSEPDETDPTGTAQIVRCVAEATGLVCAIATAYDPSTGTVVLNQTIPATYTNDPNPLFLRVWRAQLPIPAAGGTVELTDTVGQGAAANPVTTGLQVTIALPSSGVLPVGAYWSIAVRPGTPQGVYPESLLATPQPPDGPKQWVCPLAVIDWTGRDAGSPLPGGQPAVLDCRDFFENLVDLTRRKAGCCDVTVRPEDLSADPTALQKAVDSLAGVAQGTAVCLAPGIYSLSKPLQLNSRHSGLTIQGCHGKVTIQAAANSTPSSFLHGLVVMAGSNGVTLGGLTFVPPAVPIVTAIAGLPNLTNLQSLAAGIFEPNMMIGLRLLDCESVKVIGCEFQINVTSANGGSLLAAGIFANGNCTGLNVRQSHFSGPTRKLRRFSLGVEEHFSPPSSGILTDLRGDELVKDPVAVGASAAALATAVSVKDVLADNAAEGRATILNAGLTQKVAGLPTVLPTESFTPPAPPPPPAPSIMLAAFLMAPSIDATFNFAGTLIGGWNSNEAKLLSPAVLDETEFVENRMQGLTVAVLGTAALGTFVFRDNDIKDCVGGIWFGSLSQDQVGDAGLFQASLWLNIQQGVAPAVAVAIAMWYPLPQVSASTSATLSAQWHLVNNRIDALPGDGTLSGPACLIGTATPPAPARTVAAPVDSNTSVILNSNHFRNLSSPTAVLPSSLWGATAILVGAFDNIAAGNLIRNLSTPPANNTTTIYSFVVLPEQGGPVPAAAANALGGTAV
jgi:hypothetical protein